MPIDLVDLVSPSHTALVLQEVQNGVVGEPAALPQLAAEARRHRLVDHCADLAMAARAAGVPVFHCTAENRADRRGANRNARLFAGVKRAPVKLEPGSAAVEPPESVGVEPGDVVLPRYQGVGPMSGTQLDPMLRNLGVTTIVGAGVSVNIGITSLVFDAVDRGYQVVLARDAVAGVPADFADAALEHSLGLLATLSSTGAIVGAWQPRR